MKCVSRACRSRTLPECSKSTCSLLSADLAAQVLAQALRVVCDSVLEHEIDVADVRDILVRPAIDEQKVRLLARGERADAIVDTLEPGAGKRRDPDHLERREAGVDH